MSGLGKMTVEAAKRLLAVAPGVDAEGLKTARNKAMMSAHPDHGGSDEKLRRVIEAHGVLEVWLAGGGGPTKEARPVLEISAAIAMKGGRQVVSTPAGRKLAIVLPAGLRNGDKVSAGGEVYAVAIQRKNGMFVSGDDLCMVVTASAALLAKGGRIKVKTPAGHCLVWIPPQIGANRIVRVLGRGLPPRGRHPQGALVLKLEPENAAKPEPAKAKRKGWAAA